LCSRQGDLSDVQEAALKQNVVTNALQHQLNANVRENEQQVMSAYESAFRRIKESTGVSDVNEVIQKFLTQEQTHANLVNMTKDAQTRIEELARERAETKAMVDDIKYSGGASQGSRQDVDQWERKQSEIQSWIERIKARYSRFQKVFIDVRVGIEHMNDKLDHVKLDVPPVPMTDETVVDVMVQCDAKLLKMHDMVDSLGPEDSAVEPASTNERYGDASTGYNVRVTLQNDDDGDDDDDDDDGMEPEIPDREMMKKMHGMMLDKANNKGKKRRKRFGANANAPGAASAKSFTAAGSRSTGRRGLDSDM